MKENILIFGSSGHAKVVISIVEKEGKYNIVGLIDPFKPYSEYVSNYPILGQEEDLSEVCEKYQVRKGVIAIGDNKLRKKIYDKILTVKNNFQFVSIVHPAAQIASNVHIGQGTVVMPGAIVNSDSIIGNFCIINTNASLDHDCTLGNFSSLAPGVVTGGSVIIGDFSSISIGAIIRDNIKIGHQCVIGAGALVLKDIENNVVAYGLPAHKINIK